MGPYEILAPIGAGGMGEVYRAHDARIGRDVAVKILPPGFATSADRLRRFEQESRAAGMLHHPNLLTVFDVGTDNGSPYIVSELLEGETLRTKVDAGALPVRKAIDYARQIASGLAAAHEKHIVHRDLKPENIFVTRDGHVKILDFGLAKVAEPATESQITAQRNTDPGTVMGTAGYMSPEQVRGQAVDHRSDIFSFGSILYEMLTGRRAFRGESSADTMSAILREDPPEVSGSNANVPPGLDRIVRHCLEKEPAQRFQSARDLAFDLESLSGTSAGSPVSALRGRSKLAPWLVPIAALLVGIAIGAGFMKTRTPPPATTPVVRALTYSGKDLSPSVSPDGRSMAFVSTRDGKSRVWLKDLATAGEIPLTAGDDDIPRFSPDGTTLLFIHYEPESRTSLWRVAVVGGTPRKLVADATSGEWTRDGRIVFTRDLKNEAASEVFVASGDGTGEKRIAKLDRKYAAPRLSPDGKWIAITDFSPGNNNGLLTLLTIDGSQTKQIVRASSVFSGFSSTSWIDDRYLLHSVSQGATAFTNLGSMIVVLDTAKKTSVPVLQSLSSIGTVEIAGDRKVIFDTVYLRQNLREHSFNAAANPPLRWLTRSAGVDRQPAYSPDGSRIVFSSNRTGNLDLWMIGTKDGSLTRITDDAADDYDPAFTRDGKHLMWSSNRGGNFEIWMAEADGSGSHQVSNDGNDAENPTATDDGWIIYNSYNPGKIGVWKMRFDGSQAARVVTQSTELPEVSPDGKYVAYHRLSPPSAVEIVRLSDGKIMTIALARGQVRQIGAGRPRWSPDGKMLAWVDLSEKNVWGVSIQKFSFGEDTTPTRRVLAGFDSDTPIESFGFAPDGKTFTVSVLEETDTIYSADNVAAVKKR